MKPEIKYFPELKDDAMFPQWWDDFCAAARGTGMDDQIDFTKVPEKWELANYIARNQWLYVVCTHRIKTSEGKVILRRHRADQDGRAVLFDLYTHYKDSGATDLSAQELLMDITTASLDPSSSKSYLEFINNYVTSAEVYNEMQVDDGARLSQRMLMTFLQRAVSGVRTLSEVQARERHAIAEGRPPYTYDVYVTLLKAEAERQDKVRARARAARRQDLSQRRINLTAIQEDDVEEDGDAQLFEVFKTLMSKGDTKHPSTSRMDDKSFSSLSDKARKLWREIPPEDKLVMMQATPATRSINSTQIDHEVEDDEEPDGDDTSPTGQDREINETKVSFGPDVKAGPKHDTHPGDIRRVLSKSAAKKPPTKYSGKSSDSSARKINNAEWEISNVNWDMSSYGPSSRPRLVDRGANSMVVDNNLAIVDTNQPNQQDGTPVDDQVARNVDNTIIGRTRTIDWADAYHQVRTAGVPPPPSSNPQDQTWSDDEEDPIVARWPAFDDNWDDSSSDEDF